MSMEIIRKYYGVPAQCGMRVKYTGEGKGSPKFGTITGAKDMRIMVRLDSHPNNPLPFHPKWEIEYLPLHPTTSINS